MPWVFCYPKRHIANVLGSEGERRWVRHFGKAGQNYLFKSIRYIEIEIIEGVEGDLSPDAVFLHGDLVHLHVLDLELARLLIHPEIDVLGGGGAWSKSCSRSHDRLRPCAAARNLLPGSTYDPAHCARVRRHRAEKPDRGHMTLGRPVT